MKPKTNIYHRARNHIFSCKSWVQLARCLVALRTKKAVRGAQLAKTETDKPLIIFKEVPKFADKLQDFTAVTQCPHSCQAEVITRIAALIQEALSGHLIVGQTNKSFTDKSAMEKYMQGRIKAYSYLFTEILPVIPKEYKHLFCVNGQLLPGYTVDETEE